MFGGSSSGSKGLHGLSEIKRLNDSVYQLYKPAGIPSIQVVFFHGLQLGSYTDAHFSAWSSEDNSCLWPQKWLVEEIPEAHIFSVSYVRVLRNSSNASLDMYSLGENLVSDLLMANVGQVSNCPVVLVGHSIGGLVIKELCCQAHHKLQVSQAFERTKLEKFLKSMRGVFYYATPHHGSPVADRLASKLGSALLKYFKALSTDTERLNSTFDGIRKLYEKWQFAGLGEGRPTSLGWFDGEDMVVPEASVREDNFNVVEGANHFSICQPRSKTSRSFYKLKDFLTHIVNEMKVVVPIHECNGLPKHPVDLERRALDVSAKLAGGATLGIFGMGGIGKTTLAKQVFNLVSNDFEYTCFVENVKGIELHGVEDWLLSHFRQNGKKLDRGSIEWCDLKDQKILIVMDNIDSEDQLKALPNLLYFGTGSCVIMTSRDKEVFKYFEDYIPYEAEFLNDGDAKKLFCQHAFGLKDIPDLLIDSVNAVVQKCAGLPLTLEVIGAYLRDHGTNVEVWMETLDRLKKATAISGGKRDRVWASLRISYDALLKAERDMFTEAASFFFQQPLDRALAAWSSRSENMQTTWENLVSRSLVKEINNAIWVHEHLRDLADHVSKGIMVSGCDETANSTIDLLNNGKLNARTKCLRLLYSQHFQQNRFILKLDSVAKLKRLEYLDLVNVSSGGGKQGFTPKVSFIKWKGSRRDYPSMFEMNLNNLENLTVLDLSNFLVREEFSEALGSLTNLRILCLSRLEGLDRLPENFGSLCRLRHLELSDLSSLVLPESFGNLLALEDLTFKGIKSLRLPASLVAVSSLVKFRIDDCENLEGLPDSFGDCLPLLGELYIGKCPSITFLPESLGNLSSLVKLTIFQCERLSGLPNSFGWSLTSLEKLHIMSCPLITCLPHSFSQLSGLKQLRIVSCPRFKELGEAFGSLSSLRQLSLMTVALERLPSTFSRLSALKGLSIAQAPLRCLPEDFGRLTALKKLEISSAKLEALPESFRLLKSFQTLTVRCPNLTSLPESLSQLTLLEKLVLDVNIGETVPFSVGKLFSLRYLEFKSSGAKLLPECLEQLSLLKVLKIECDQLEILPNSLGRLSSLEELSISSSRLELLPDCLVQLSSLKRLTLSSKSMEKLPDDIMKLSSVEELSFSLPSLEVFPGSIRGLSNLRKLNLLLGTKVKSLPEDFGHLVALRYFHIGADKLQAVPDSFSLLKTLEKFTLRCRKLKKLPDDVGNMSSLEELSVEAKSLQGLPESIGHLNKLRKLELRKADRLKRLPESLGQLVALQHLTIVAPQLQRLPASFPLLKSLQTLTLLCRKLKRLPDDLGNLSALVELSILSDNLVRLPESIGCLLSLRRLKLRGAAQLNVMPDIFGKLSTLEKLTVCIGELETLPASICLLKSLQRLKLHCYKLERLPDDLGNLSSLESLSIQSRSLESLPETVGRLRSLKKVSLAAGNNVKMLLDDFAKIPSIQQFQFDCNGHEKTVSLFSSISSFPHELTLQGYETRMLPTGLDSLSSLRALSLESLPLLKTLPDELGMLSSLERLNISCKTLERLPDSVGQISSLREVRLSLCKRLKTLPESLGKSSSTQQALPQGDRSDTPRFKAGDSSGTAGAMQLIVRMCPFLDVSVLDSLGWMFIDSDPKDGHYQRKPHTEEGAPSYSSDEDAILISSFSPRR